MGSKTFLFLGLFLAIFLMISSEVAARELAETSNSVKSDNENEVAVDGRSGYNGIGGDGHYGGGYGHGGGYKRKGCRYSCCRKTKYGCKKYCCSYAEYKAMEKVTDAQTQN
ncbi:hypothetical protein HAX54_031001 [Datura stramonium]|uniref:Glycine-rich protein-like n=1 Tax=Datura stramonium TaxID=4076 RepID=A0ABS8Y6H8_DATST|nr:hypothetical protein [Datura stramonium]